jgi:hypothetical protein
MSTVSGLEIANNVEREWRDRLEAAVKAEREKVSEWMIQQGYATGHGDTIEDLLKELEWQIAENWTNALVKGVEGEREACAKLCDEIAIDMWNLYKGRPPYKGDEEGRASDFTQGRSAGADNCAEAIRKRSNT